MGQISYFLYPGGNASRAARWDIAYLEQCVYDLCSNGILIDTVSADSTLCLPTDETRNNKQKQGNKMPFSLYITWAIINMSPINWAHSSALLIVGSKPKASAAN